jgi:hypothetical protein
MLYNGRGMFTWRGVTFRYETGLHSTDYGPERWIKIFEVTEQGDIGYYMQDTASVGSLIRQFKDYVEDLERCMEENADEWDMVESRGVNLTPEQEEEELYVPEGDVDHDDEDRRAYNEERNQIYQEHRRQELGGE